MLVATCLDKHAYEVDSLPVCLGKYSYEDEEDDASDATFTRDTIQSGDIRFEVLESRFCKQDKQVKKRKGRKGP